ncbi:MAG: ArsR family transcriptional regulator [Methylobacterium sp.]|jgi:Lrp/AsnC family transcriptional regulator|uniref:Lrp/AsnC family transcriptional regulator n=1 Tax=Bosea sp. (in: a-proteobacteria) TaxID=1871050 RepID=UPI000A7D674B|nr:Lrp/AsnC family transcriptional regulator [Bosea sp. (in: a-proteobacteria)]MBA4268244.1 ArsR family transcriptional regulator [Methylobacterium sp.]MBX9875738.1 Lrp/AsnC family transcriptional regulator [Beijerinckiaceae bacterium]MBA4333821.1 ArsR family transcriptional regulator [Methylobacterium sp.]MCZ8044437.1 Lrp/AsnC family transcriptional regulator [Beijerinckiaceae bacterium]WRH56497.1 MAG: Lrp/AsnC family transcriptional regulator [Bosea sp. (in: a-proteobacteria)]
MAKLDAFDLRILACLQEDASLPLAELSEAVGLSATPCWRRVQKLEAAGYIRKRVALLDRSKLQAGVTVFIAVKTARHSMEWLERFHAAVRDLPEIVDFYRMSGEIDYLLKACVPDIAAYDALYKKLISRIDLNDVTSMFAMEELKSTTAIPLGFVLPEG